jgi:integrase
MPAYRDPTGRWRYRFAYQGRRYSGSAPVGSNTKRTAETLERAHIDKLGAGVFTGEMPKLEKFAEQFIAHQAGRIKGTSLRSQRNAVNKHIVPQLGRLRLDQIDRRAIDGAVTVWLKTLSPKTVNARLLATLQRMLSLAVEWKYLPRAPDIEQLAKSKETPRFLTRDEAERLLHATPEKWRSMVFVALRTGLRVGELRALRWGDVDFTRRNIQVRHTDPGRAGMDETTPKGGAERTVPMTPDTAALLKAMWPGLVEGGVAVSYVWPGFRSRSKFDPQRARSENACTKAIRAAFARIGLREPGLGWHTLRHTYASWLAMDGLSLRRIQRLLGHASITMTEIYAHLQPDDHDHQAVSVLDRPRQATTNAIAERSVTTHGDTAIVPPDGVAPSHPAGECPTCGKSWT